MKLIVLTLLLTPLLSHAQDAQSLVTNTTNWLSTIVIPFLIGIAFLFFVINAIRYFIISGGDTEAHEKARALATYGILAFVVLMVFWGVINMLVSSIGLDCNSVESKSVSSDYVWKDFVGATKSPCN